MIRAMSGETSGGVPSTAETERRLAEQVFHDRQARESAASHGGSEGLWVDDDVYLDHESWIRPALAQFGDLRGTRVLDFGSGHGMAAVVMARRGARVTAFDLSSAYLQQAHARACANYVEITAVHAAALPLPFPDHAFDRIWGNAVLHHVDLESTIPELARVLAPGGIAVFCEPWDENPLLAWARRSLPYPNKGRTRDERPLRSSDLAVLHHSFPQLRVRGYQLLSMVGRLGGPVALRSWLEACDRLLLRLMPGLQRFCRYIVVVVQKPTVGQSKLPEDR